MSIFLESKRLGVEKLTLLRAIFYHFVRLSDRDKAAIVLEYYEEKERIQRERPANRKAV